MSRSKRNKRPAATAQAMPAPQADIVMGARKPRIMMAGEFSAGKTRLISGLLGSDILPSNVTATALPPVWLVHGAPGMAVVDLDGTLREIDTLEDVTVQDTQYCLISHPAKILEQIDIIDTPGSSDPNIPAESWERMLGFADHAVWCTNATQAWRQSEKSVWNEMPEHLAGAATVLITHADRMPDQRTADRVLRRVQREAKDYFQHFMMASLIKSDDIADITRHILQLCSAQIALNGADATLVADFASEQADKAKELQAAGVESPVITPKRITPRSKPDAVATDDTDDIRPASAEVVVLDPATHKVSATQDKTTVRLVWKGILEGANTKDAAAVLERVERFLSLLEDNDVFTENATAASDAAQAEADDALITSNVITSGSRS